MPPVSGGPALADAFVVPLFGPTEIVFGIREEGSERVVCGPIVQAIPAARIFLYCSRNIPDFMATVHILISPIPLFWNVLPRRMVEICCKARSIRLLPVSGWMPST
jgi:hypothetical protein